MYRVTAIQINGHLNTERFHSMNKALDRFNSLKAKNKKFNLGMKIYLEELLDLSFQEYQIHEIV